MLAVSMCASLQYGQYLGFRFVDIPIIWNLLLHNLHVNVPANTIILSVYISLQ
jgi:hypothetical protein